MESVWRLDSNGTRVQMTRPVRKVLQSWVEMMLAQMGTAAVGMQRSVSTCYKVVFRASKDVG